MILTNKPVTEKLKLLHIIDDQKFMPYCERTFSLPGVDNTYSAADRFKESVTGNFYDVIIVHYLRKETVEVLNDLPIDRPVIWFFWGADGFCLGKFYSSFLLPKARAARLKLSFKKSLQNGIKTLVKTVFPQSIDNSAYSKALIKSFGKISIVVPIVPGDFELLKKNYTVNFPSFHLNYVSPVFDQDHNELFVNGDNILIGNSASYTNNHIEIIDALAKIELGKRKVIIPLSYGNRLYGNFVKKYAEKKLSNIVCLIDFLPFDEYQKIVQSCSVVVMNHLRQQALGNVVHAFMAGSQLYMQPSSTLYQYLKEQSFYVFSVDELVKMKKISKFEQAHNIQQCIKVFGKETQQVKAQRLIENALLLHHPAKN